ncbi:MAG: hypothetical protein PHI99_03970, partial [Syntrophales bacterium]|nr:hypothetical protein [Syntrophales bacterium]
PDSEQIHTFRQEGPCLLGCDIDRPKIIELFRKYKPELSGEKATAMNHGIVLKDDTGWLFIETRKE